MARRLGCWTCNSEAPSSSPALTASWICSQQSRVQILDHACKCDLVCLWPVWIVNHVMFALNYLFQEFGKPD